MHIAEAGPDSIRHRIYQIFEESPGSDSAFPIENGCSKILAKYADNPYSYELLPEYESGEKQLPQAKAPYWDGKYATYKTIRQFTKTHL